ncbi:hypothetical protein T190611E02C_60057 [Tenacibaculum sp. 190524A05c]
MLYLWENKKKQKEKIDLFLNTNQLKLVKKINTSIILGCFNAIPSITKKDKFDLTDTEGNVLETNLTQIEVSKKIEAYEKAAKKEGILIDEYLRRINNFKKFGFKIFKFSNRFDDHIRFGHIRIEVINNSVNKRLSNGLPNPDYIEEVYEYVVSRGGRTVDSLGQGKVFKVKAWGGSHFLKNLDGKNVRIATPKTSLSGNISTFKLSTGETVRKVQLEYFIKETNTWKLKNDPSTMWPKEWDILKVRNVINDATKNIYFNNGDNLFRGITPEGYKIEFRVNRETKEIDTAYIIF